MTRRRIRLHWRGVLAFGVTVTGALVSPCLLGFVSERTAIAIILAGAILQGITRAIQDGPALELEAAPAAAQESQP